MEQSDIHLDDSGLPSINTENLDESMHYDDADKDVTLDRSEKPSKTKIIMVLVCGLAIFSALIWVGVTGYKSWVKAHSTDSNSDFSDYVVQSPPKAADLLGGSKNSELSGISEHGLESEPPARESEVNSLLPAENLISGKSSMGEVDFQSELIALKKSIDKLLVLNQQLLNGYSEFIGLVKVQGTDLATETISMKDALNGLIASNEAILSSLSKKEPVEKKVELPSLNVPSSNNLPTFRVVEPSIWGSSVKFGIEQSNGFYRTVEQGDIVEGWHLISFDLKTKTLLWKRDENKYEMHYL